MASVTYEHVYKCFGDVEPCSTKYLNTKLEEEQWTAQAAQIKNPKQIFKLDKITVKQPILLFKT